MAFQPIIDSTTRKVFSQEALIRGLDQETAFDILSPITDENRYQFDQACRVKAIDDLGAGYSGLNFLAKFQPDIIKLEFP
jgi:EAL domain-containing protein (putative c-di-GMP-specific phosphodiesterase class I)